MCRGWAKAAEAADRGDLTEVRVRKILNEILENAGQFTPHRELDRIVSLWPVQAHNADVVAPGQEDVRHFLSLGSVFPDL